MRRRYPVMYKPPKLWSAHLDDLVAGVGGAKAACKLLDVSPRTLKRWQAGDPVPKMALDLLWYCGPEGKAAAEADFQFIGAIERGISDDRRREIDRLQVLLKSYQVNGPAVLPREKVAAMAVNDEFGALPPRPEPQVKRWK